MLITQGSVVRVHSGPQSGDVAQLGERLPCTEEVRGSSPLISIGVGIYKYKQDVVVLEEYI